MRYCIALILMLNSFCSSAQIIKFNVQGAVKDAKPAKFAYLTTLSHQGPISSSKLFMVTPIVNGKFDFKGSFDLDGKGYQHAAVFLDSRGNISKEELASKFEQLILVVDREKNFKHLILEDISLDVAGYDQMQNASIKSGGKQTKQLHEWFAAIRTRNKAMLAFVKKYPDSRMSLDAITEIYSGIGDGFKDKSDSYYGTLKELYSLLSDHQKKSKQGIALKKKIYDL